MKVTVKVAMIFHGLPSNPENGLWHGTVATVIQWRCNSKKDYGTNWSAPGLVHGRGLIGKGVET